MNSKAEHSNEIFFLDILPRPYLHWLVIAVLMAGFALRLVGLSYPPYDAHSYRQTQTLSTIENYYAEGIDLLHPKTIYKGYPGTFVLEVPVFQAAAAALYRVFGQHLEIVRLLNIFIGACTMWLVFRIGSYFLGGATGMAAAMIYWLAPLNIIYQRSMLIDPIAVLFGMICFHRLMLLLAPSGSDTKVKNAWNTRNLVIFALAACLTALIKALYLWPAVLLLGQHWLLRRLRFDRRIIQIIAIFAGAGIFFLIWNAYATRVNDLSRFTRGLRPTSLLGFSALLTPDFYNELLLHRPKRWLGALGILFYTVGFFAALMQKPERPRSSTLFLIFLIPPTYLLGFANINRPHDYYQLIITPFLAIASGFGLTEIMVFLRRKSVFASSQRIFAVAAASVFMVASIFTYLIWMHAPRLDPDLLRFEKLCAGKFALRHPGMLFVGSEVSHQKPDSYIPEYLYAANLWGYGRVVENSMGARSYFEEFAPAFSKLDFVVFYGTDFPNWFPKTNYEEYLRDATNQLYVFKRTAAL